MQWTEFTVYAFAEVTNVSGLGVSYSLGKIEGISRGPVWLGVPFPWTEFVFQCKVWWMLVRSYTGVFVYTNLESTRYWQVDRGMKLNGAAVEARLTLLLVLEPISLLDPPRT